MRVYWIFTESYTKLQIYQFAFHSSKRTELFSENSACSSFTDFWVIDSSMNVDFILNYSFFSQDIRQGLFNRLLELLLTLKSRVFKKMPSPKALRPTASWTAEILQHRQRLDRGFVCHSKLLFHLCASNLLTSLLLSPWKSHEMKVFCHSELSYLRFGAFIVRLYPCNVHFFQSDMERLLRTFRSYDLIAPGHYCVGLNIGFWIRCAFVKNHAQA